MQGLGLHKTDIMEVFWVKEYEEYDKGSTLCVGIHNWYESLKSFATRYKNVHPEWCGPLMPPE
jgi:hypothetical protein